jgi:glutamine synthetase
VGLVGRLRKSATALEKVATAHADAPMKHAQHIKAKVLPAMQDLRTVADELQLNVADEFWPMPTYRDLLFLK